VDNAYWWSCPDKSYFAALSFNDSGVGMGYISKIWVLGCPASKVGWVQPIKSFIWSRYVTKRNTIALDTTAGEEIVGMKTFLSTGGPCTLGVGEGLTLKNLRLDKTCYHALQNLVAQLQCHPCRMVDKNFCPFSSGNHFQGVWGQIKSFLNLDQYGLSLKISPQ